MLYNIAGYLYVLYFLAYAIVRQLHTYSGTFDSFEIELMTELVQQLCLKTFLTNNEYHLTDVYCVEYNARE